MKNPWLQVSENKTTLLRKIQINTQFKQLLDFLKVRFRVNPVLQLRRSPRDLFVRRSLSRRIRRRLEASLSSCEKKAWKIWGLNGIRTHDLYDAVGVLHQLSYQANCELVMWICNIPGEVKGCHHVSEMYETEDWVMNKREIIAVMRCYCRFFCRF